MRVAPPVFAALLVAAACGPPADRMRSLACAPPGDSLETSELPTTGWRTDLSRRCVPLRELVQSVSVRDGIPPIDEPRGEPIVAAERWLDPEEPVVAVVESGAARAYPLQLLVWHEVVNDRLGGRPILVTF